ncbi:MAG: hypothetical protein JWN82_83 [Candidatus Saccharibacteria bacterium]|nr:hypothetical protein [Candidatus Saccharibacteria bacterium]
MTRSTLDKIIASSGLVLAVVLLLMSGALFWAHDFIHGQVKEQLSAQKITFPAASGPEIAALPAADKDQVSKYAGQALTSGAQAKVYADNYIAAHLQHIGDGKTYAELSAAAIANPTDQALAGKAQTVFKGETLRGLLLNAYAFDTMAIVAKMAALVSLTGAVVLLVLAVLGFRHAGSVKRR